MNTQINTHSNSSVKAHEMKMTQVEKSIAVGSPFVISESSFKERRLIPRTVLDEVVLGDETHQIGMKELPPTGAAIKRVIDIAGALFGILLLSPLMIGAAILIKMSSKGPIFFKQKRMTKGGETFDMWKFRTMIVDADKLKDQLASQNEMSGPVFKIKNDPRITPVGRFLRKYSIDELPQLFNVLFGDMSLVGPRPPVYREVVKYRRWQARRLTVKTGLTCIWQISGRNQIDFENWMRMDLQYIDQWSLWMDIKILFKTVAVVVKGDGAS